MSESLNLEPTSQRLLRSARLLKAFYEHKHRLTLELLTEAPSEPLVEGMQFDLRLSTLGIWGLRATQPLPEKTQAEISAGFHGLVGAFDNLEDRREHLARLEQMYQAITEERERPANVLPFRRPGAKAGSSAIRDRRWILRLDCLIESKHLSEIHKMALELHAHSQRYAFIEYVDLSKSCRLSLSELQQIGPATVFVPSILDLTLDEQAVLRELLKQDTLQRPLLMVGAHLPYSDLRSEPAIDLEFLALLSRAYIKLTRPFAEYRDQGLIHYFLDSLSQSPT